MILAPLALLAILSPSDAAEGTVELVPQFGNSADITSLALSPDGTWIATAGADASVRLWDSRSGLIARVLVGNRQRIEDVAFSPDSRLLSSASEDGSVRTWDVQTGEIIEVFLGHDDEVMSVAYAPRDGFVPAGTQASAGRSGEILFRDPEAPLCGKALRTNADRIGTLAFSQDGRWFAWSGNEMMADAIPERPLWELTEAELDAFADRLMEGSISNDVLQIWDFQEGKKVFELHAPVGSFDSLSFSEDGDRLFSSGRDFGEGLLHGSSVVTVWDVESGEKLLCLNDEPHWSSPVVGPAGEPGQMVVASCTIEWREIASGEVLHRQQSGGCVEDMVVAPGGKTFATLTSEGVVTVWNSERHEPLWDVRAPEADEVMHVAVDTETETVLGYHRSGTVQTWDLGQLWPGVRFRPGDFLQEGSFSSDGRRFFVPGADESGEGFVETWDTHSGSQVGAMGPVSSDFEGLCESPSGDLLVTSSGEEPLVVWDLHTGSMQGRYDLGKYATPWEDLAVTWDDRLLITADFDVALWRLDRPGRRAHRRPWRKFSPARLGHENAVRSLAVSPDGTLAITGSYDGTACIWTVPAGRTRHVLRPDPSPHHYPWGLIRAVAFSPDGAFVAAGSEAGIVFVYDVDDGSLLHTFHEHSSAVNDVVFSDDGRFLVSGGADGQIVVRRIDSEAAVVLITDGEHWLGYRGDGTFTASRDGGGLLAVLANGRTARIDQFAAQFNRPDLLLEELGTGSTELISSLRQQYRRRLSSLGHEALEGVTPVLGIAPEAELTNVTVSEGSARLSIRLSSQQDDIAGYRLYLNGVPAHGVTGQPVEGALNEVVEEIALVPGRNVIEVSALDRYGREGWRDIRLVETDDLPSSLFFVGLGVSRYEDERLNLAYAAKDAKNLSEVFGAMGEGYDKIDSLVMTDGQVTHTALMEVSRFLSGSSPQDTVVLFFAGHGLYSSGDDAEYYLLSSDARLQDLPGTALSYGMLEDLLLSIPARQKLVLLDACQSGARDPDGELAPFTDSMAPSSRARTLILRREGVAASPPPWTPDRFIMSDLARRTGAVVFSSSRGVEVSFEDEKIRNGVFTEEILRALTGEECDVNGDKELSLPELRGCVWRQVSTRTGGRQNPTVDRDNITQHIALPLVPEAVETVLRDLQKQAGGEVETEH